jgi:para-nitrobenzyl esterase
MKGTVSGSRAAGKKELNRRSVMKLAATLMTAATGATAVSRVAAAGTRAGDPGATDVEGQPTKTRLRAGKDIATVETEAGRIAGYTRNGIHMFKGVPYGATTAGKYRFLPPRKPDPWVGVRSSRQYGLIAAQDKGTGRLNDEEAFIFRWNDSVAGEDCLRINIWTPGLRDNTTRPVMVWLHGGAFAAGSGHDIPAFDGENLSRRGNAVVVSLNHRLNLLGFLDLSEYGESYARSANVGLLDIVAALQWIRDNIAEFGGDPNQVMIFGQSGGGGKVSALMGMPEAKGLFHSAVVQSGSFAFAIEQHQAQRLTRLLVEELGLGKRPVDQMQSLPYKDLLRATDMVMQRHNPPPALPGVRALNQSLNFGPVVDGVTIPDVPFGNAAPGFSSNVPLIVGTTLNEFANATGHPEYELMTEAELLSRTEELFPGRSAAVVDAFRQRTPKAMPFDLWSRIATSRVRDAAVRQASLKSRQGGAPVWLYLFSWQTPVLDGRPRAFHCLDIPFVFDNTDRCDHMTGGGPDARKLGQAMADTWVQFARSGDPNHNGIPTWDAYSDEPGVNLIFDNRVHTVPHPDREELQLIRQGA